MNALVRCVVCVLLCGVPLCGGCAFGHKYNIHEITPTVSAVGTGQLGVATHDQRSYVVSAGTDPSLVGLSRSGFGIPYPVYTKSDRPLAEDMTQVICNALRKKGFQCVPVIVAVNTSPGEVRRKLREHANPVAILFVLNEWKS